VTAIPKTIELDDALRARLDYEFNVSPDDTDRVIHDAVSEALDLWAWQGRKAQAGKEQIELGHGISHEKVVADTKAGAVQG
jgi:predicted transcriptional regulator